jgi:hypothetical protein
MVGGEHVLAQRLVQGFEPPAGTIDPSGKRRTAKIDAVSSKNLRLPVERRVIAILADQHLSQQRRRRQPAGDRSFWSRSLGECSTGTASIFWTSDPHNAKPRRHPVEHLALALADAVHDATAAWAGLGRHINEHILAR